VFYAFEVTCPKVAFDMSHNFAEWSEQ